jgi:hypothetical protein
MLAATAQTLVSKLCFWQTMFAQIGGLSRQLMDINFLRPRFLAMQMTETQDTASAAKQEKKGAQTTRLPRKVQARDPSTAG